MDELDRYGSFNTRYEGVGQLWYVDKDAVPVSFEARQLEDGRLLIGCAATTVPIGDGPTQLEGHLLSGERFSTIWGLGITEVFRDEGRVSKAHYVASRIRVRYTQALEPRSVASQFALHNFIPGRHTDVSANAITIPFPKGEISIVPVGNYKQQRDQLLSVGGNLRTSWVKETPSAGSGMPPHLIHEILLPLSLALGTKVTAPQLITFDANGDRNDVEHYATIPAPFSDYIAAHGWDAPVKDTVQAWLTKQVR